MQLKLRKKLILIRVCVCVCVWVGVGGLFDACLIEKLNNCFMNNVPSGFDL